MKCVLCRKELNKENGPYFRVPAEEPRRQRWNIACSMSFAKGARVCYEHFTSSDFALPPGSSLPARLKVGAVPFIVSSAVDIAETCPAEDISVLGANFDSNRVSRVNCCTQTDPDEISEGALIVLTKLKQQVKDLQIELAKTKAELEEAKQMNAYISTVFTAGQIRKLQQPEMVHIHWESQDISNAVCLHAAGPKAYNHLYKQGFPLPHVSTLQRWARKVEISEGILSIAINCMRNNTDLSADEKICVLSFDEMKVAAVYEHDPSTDSVREPCNYVQVAMARGLKKSWKYPVFYAFDCKMTKAIIAELINVLKDASFPVVALVSDMGSTNQALWKELRVSREKPWFENPTDINEKVFVLADVPHLIKLVRNHFLDTGIIWNNALLTTQTLKQVLHHCSSSDMSIAYKLSDEHLSTRGPGRQKVKLAVQLFSHTTACAIRWCYTNGKDVYKPEETSEFIELMNNWFDVLNSKMTTYNYPRKKPYGNDLQYQDDILMKMDAFMESIILPNRKTLAPFQRGVLMTNSALRFLRTYLKEKYNINYILTYRLNQDILEHFFGAIRSKGGLNDHPSPLSFKYRLRKYILGNHFAWTIRITTLGLGR